MAPAIQCFLKIIDGRIVTVRMYQKGLELCAVEDQNGGQNGQCVHIVKKQPKKKTTQMAFYFQREQDYYLPMVEGGVLKLQKSGGITDTLSDHYWFKKENLRGNEHYSLRSVVEPGLYVCVHNDNSLSDNEVDQCKFFLSTDNQQCVQVTDEKIE